MTYKTLSMGSTGDDVKKLQKALGINDDGIYGQQTQSAVKAYQQKNGLNPDGIAGNITQTRLYGGTQGTKPTVQTPAAVQVPSAPTYDPTYDSQLDELYQKIVGRDKFSYDAFSDPLYRQYADLYTQQGRMAMQDTMGKAAALTGGYGSSYAQSVGQQQYDAYLQKLNEALPELYGMARDEYDAEGNALMQQYGLLEDRRNDEYTRYENELSRYNNERDTAYERLVSLITNTGYEPTDAELAASGLTRAQAQAYASAYAKKNSSGSSVKDVPTDPKPVLDPSAGTVLDAGEKELFYAYMQGEITPNEFDELLNAKRKSEGNVRAR